MLRELLLLGCPLGLAILANLHSLVEVGLTVSFLLQQVPHRQGGQDPRILRS